MKRFIAVILAVLMAVSALMLAGCKLAEEEPEASAGETDMSAIVASVGDETVTMAEYKDMFDMYSSYYSQLGYDFSADSASLAEFQNFIVEMLLSEKAVIYQAKLAGMDQYTDEESVTLEEECDTAVKDMEDYYRTMAEEESAADPNVDVEARIIEMIEDESEYYTGSHKSYDEYVEWLKQEARDNYLYTKMQDSVYAELSVSQADIDEWAAAKIAESSTSYADDPGAYKDAQENYEMYGGEPVMTVPDGFSRIYHIFVTSESELPEEYTANETRMTEIEASYGPLAFEDAVNGTSENKAELDELISEYNELKTANDTMDEDRFAAAKTTADEAYAKLEAGEEFAAVMKEYTQDADFTGFEIFMDKGMLISSEYASSVDWSDEIKAEFAKLEVGGHSGVFSDSDGYHIIYYVGDELAGDRSSADYKEDIEAIVLAEKQENEWNALLTEWLADESVFRDAELIASMGK